MSPLSLAQLAQRSQFLGASDIPAVAGLNPWKGPIDIYLRKTGQAIEEDDPEADFRKMLGHRIEGLIAELYAEKMGVELAECPTIIHPDEPWAGCTPDRQIVGRDAGVEIKNVGALVAHHWANDEPPDYVTAQAQYQIWIMGWSRVDIAALIGGRDFVVHSVLRDEETITMLAEIGRRFWHEHVVPKIPPPIDGSNTWREFLARKFPTSRDGMGQAPEDAERWARQYLDAVAQEGATKAMKSEAGNHLRAIIGELDGIMGDGWKATWKGEDGARILRVSEIKAKANRRAA
jgi:putative phage-type endonuclease